MSGTKDFYPYAVFVLSPAWADEPGWGEAVWTGDANGHSDALSQAKLIPQGSTHIDALTVCLCDDGPPTMRQWKVKRVVEAMA